MSLSATLANALSGLNVAQQALSVTANNVANANTPGYSRKVLNQESMVLTDLGQ
jgi:flagellar hook-associated protein 1